jgi:hypothetical protein
MRKILIHEKHERHEKRRAGNFVPFVFFVDNLFVPR